MILRAVFWIGLIAILLPKEPDLGFGRPGVHLSPIATIMALLPGNHGAPSCDAKKPACIETQGAAKAEALQSLQEVRLEIEQSRKDREAHR